MCVMSADAQAKAAGQNDAQVGMPDWQDAEHAPYVRHLADRHNSLTARVEQLFDRADTVLYRRFTLARATYQQRKEQRDEAQADFDEAVNQYEAENGKKPVGVRPVNHVVYWLGMFLLMFLLEVPLSFASFKLLRQPLPIQAMLAVGAALILCMLAHFAASWLIRPSRNRLSGYVIFYGAVPATLLGLSYFRELYVQAAQADALALAGAESGIPAVHVGLVAGTFVFFLVTVLAYVLGIFWALHELDPLALAMTQLRTAKHAFACAERRFQLTYQARVKNAYLHHSKALQVQHRCFSLVALYNMANLRERAALAQQNKQQLPPGRPASFLQYPYIDISEHLRDPVNKLNWS